MVHDSWALSLPGRRPPPPRSFPCERRPAPPFLASPRLARSKIRKTGRAGGGATSLARLVARLYPPRLAKRHFTPAPLQSWLEKPYTWIPELKFLDRKCVSSCVSASLGSWEAQGQDLAYALVLPIQRRVESTFAKLDQLRKRSFRKCCESLGNFGRGARQRGALILRRETHNQQRCARAMNVDAEHGPQLEESVLASLGEEVSATLLPPHTQAPAWKAKDKVSAPFRRNKFWGFWLPKLFLSPRARTTTD